MRVLTALVFLATPAAAWEAGAQGPVCFLRHATDEAEVTVTHDPRNVLPYAIELARRDTVWDVAPSFVIRFDGPAARTIATDRHLLSDGGAALTVSDRGFGNVLDGIAFNHVAIAVTGDQALVIPLAGAAPEVEKFRACTAAPGV